MKFNLKKIVMLLVALAVVVTSMPVQAAYPEKPVSIVIGYKPGGGTDIVARIMADVMSKMTKHKFVVQNMPGAGSGLAQDTVADSKPDGYQIYMSTSMMNLVKKLGQSKYTYADMDQLGSVNYDAPALIVNSDSKCKTLEDFIKYAKEAKEKINIGTSLPAGIWHMALIRFVKRAGIEDKVNVVPNTGGGGGQNVALLGRHVEAIFNAPNEASSQLKNKEFRILAIAAPERSETFKDVPTFREKGIDCSILTMRGFHAPKGLPADVRAFLVKAIKDAAASKEFKDFAENTFSIATYMSPEDYRKYNDGEYPDYLKLLDETGLVKK